MKTLRMMTDEELVVLYAEGNNAAFDVLLNRYKSSIHSYIYFIVHNKDLTEDIFQETFVKVIMTIKQGRYTENGKFKAWITRIAHNLIIDNFRQERSENTVSNDEVEVDLFNNIKLCDGTIEDNIVRRQVLSDVKIADITGVSINTALGRMRYAILNMRRMAEENSIELSMA